ncbi:MAG: penicillin acylase family protein [Xanthomonadales bacterium]|nr:penicillin acylase family protein [Xanthomonadales bacterium]
MKLMTRFLNVSILFALVFLASCSREPDPATVPAHDSLADRAQNITIIRDDFGVPHIYAQTDADAVFGLLYAQAEDDFNRIERNYIWAIGRLAEIEGEKAIFSDLRARLFMTIDEAKAAYKSAPGWLKELCDAWADGLNYYLETYPDVKPKLLTRFEPWMPMFFSEGSIGGDIEQIPLDGIEAFYGENRSLESLAATQSGTGDLREPTGSNGFAIAGKLTRSGNAMLLINPHTSFYFRGEVHVVSEEGLNAYGAVTWGQFFVYQGFNENTGWMHTSTYVDFIDEFIEDISRNDGKLSYRFGDEQLPVEVSEVKLKYKDGDNMSERSFEVYHTHHGPVTHMLDGKWVATKINWDPVNALRQSYIRTKQNDHDGFREMMDIRTNSSNNTVYADSQGNIAYYHGNFVPRRDSQFDFSQPVDGSNPATDWQGLHTVDETITLLNPENGWLQNCNSTPFTAAAEFSPEREDYPVYMAPDAESFRGIHAVNVLTGISDMTLDKLIEISYDPYLPGFEQLIPGLIMAFDESGEDFDELSPAIDVLRTWDLKVSRDSIAMSLAHFYAMRYKNEGANPNGLSGMHLINYFGTASPHTERLQIFAATLQSLSADFGRWDAPQGENSQVQYYIDNNEQLFDDDGTETQGYEQLIPGLVTAFDESGEDFSELTSAINLLRTGGLDVSEDPRVRLLVQSYGERYEIEGANPNELRGMDLINYFGSSSPHVERLQIFAATLASLANEVGLWRTPWGEINRFQRITGDIDQPFNDDAPSLPVGMASGRWGALASFGARAYPGTKRIYGNSGNSFVAVVEFGDKVKAKSLLAGGQSGDPESPHFDDQAQRYVYREFKDVAYYKEDVLKRATKTYHPGEVLP